MQGAPGSKLDLCIFPSVWEGLRTSGNSPMYNSYGCGFTSPENFVTDEICTKFYQVSWF